MSAKLREVITFKILVGKKKNIFKSLRRASGRRLGGLRVPQVSRSLAFKILKKWVVKFRNESEKCHDNSVILYIKDQQKASIYGK